MLREIPREIDTTRGFRRIEDLYVEGTRLRLRRVTDDGGSLIDLKLTQKYRDPEKPFFQTVITNLYLTDEEFSILSCVGGHQLIKKRYDFHSDGRRYSIDAFEGKLSGLVLAETEFDHDDEASSFEVPSFAIRDVTNEDLFTGGHLAFAKPDVVRNEWRS